MSAVYGVTSPVAEEVSYDNSVSGLVADNVQAAITELASGTSDFDMILCDNHFDILFDNEGNVLTGV
jgi:hypothetical protein